MKFFTLPALLAAALFSAVVSLPFMPFGALPRALYRFEVTVTSSQRGDAQLFFDIGQGIREDDSVHAPVDGDGARQTLHFNLPAGHYTALRFDPLDRSANMTLADAVLRDSSGAVVRRFAAGEFKAEQQVSVIAQQPDGSLRLEFPPNSPDPITSIVLPEPLELPVNYSHITPALLRIALPVFLGLLALFAALTRVPLEFRARCVAWLGALAAKPGRAVAVVAAIGVVASSYPVVFLGKSFVSPNFGAVLLYESFPTLPGYRASRVAVVKGADVGAVMWQHVPYSMLEGRALLHGELPLWNRYNSAGATLLGQGQSMFGDPLHFFVIAAGGAAWAWDLKYLAAKWLLATGIGLCVLRLTRHLPAAAIVAAVMPFIGYFVFRVNHPAIFSTCYAPWILYCWLGIAMADRWRGAAAWVGGLMLANWSVMNSGTVKEAYMSLLTLNFAGACALAGAALAPRERLRRFALAAVGGAILILLAAPIWITFLDDLAQSYNSYDAARAYQVQPSLALAFFDEILFRPFWEHENVYNGSVNFVVLLGVLAFLVNLRRLCADRLILALTLASVVPLALIFGVVPPAWIVRVPFLGNVAHIDNSFFCPMITLLGVFAGCGFFAVARRLGGLEGRGDLALGLGLLGVLAAHYVAFGQTVQRSTYSYWHWGEQIARSPFVVGDLIALLLAATGFAWLARSMLRRRSADLASLLALGACTFVMLWRHGQQIETGFSDYVLAPPSRVNFHAASPALTAARADQHGEPWRYVGLNGNAFHGWMNVYGFEGISGPDALMNAYYRELQTALGFERIWDWRIYAQAPTLAAQKRGFDVLNVRYYFDYGENPAVREIVTPVTVQDLAVYRSETAWPRAFFTDRVAVYDEANAFGQLVKTGDGRPFAAMQRRDPALAAPLPADLTGRTVVPAHNYRLTANTTAFEIDAPGPGVVVLTETWRRKDFRARLDGQPVPYLRLNHAFKGLAIANAGHHRIEFEFWPRRFDTALALSGVGALLLVGAIVLVRRTPRLA